MNLNNVRFGFSIITGNIYIGLLDNKKEKFKAKRLIDYEDKIAIRMAYEYLKNTEDKDFLDILNDNRYIIEQ